jgi:hypothetical protein
MKPDEPHMESSSDMTTPPTTTTRLAALTEGVMIQRPWDMMDLTDACFERPHDMAFAIRAVNNFEALVVALDWAMDLLDMYDERLAKIDGADKVYTTIHLLGKECARAALEKALVKT